MNVIADILLGTGALAAAFYCHVLSGRLKRFTTLETGMGGAIAVLSAQVDDMTLALESARKAAHGSANGLEALVQRAEGTAARLELMLAAMHDLPEPGQTRAVAEDDDDTSERPLRFLRRRATRPPLEAAE
jgi:hypothetical protein